ncbi:MAG: DUF4437 domain-containing protein [Phenylobacterium sp.]|uniref:DUF4437 domain-containing protein n=1 Tax=Phenylobacterium sp. TaxID=1871053 RepID=UPI002734AC3C|nr:DUF4437 domain-containing protein [Phenylobacterium sp.]MDP3748196.1 DUF4437 domain-containing protein [Phenylobacterium sp.]
MSPNSPSERLIAGAVLALTLVAPASAADPEPRNISRPAADHAWRKQSPELSTQLTVLWGDRDKDGTFGQLVKMPPGFDSGLHAHSGDYHGVLVSGTWAHVDASGKGADVPLGPGSYVRQPGGEMHIDRCVSQEPCVLFTFQYARADVIWPAKT